MPSIILFFDVCGFCRQRVNFFLTFLHLNTRFFQPRFIVLLLSNSEYVHYICIEAVQIHESFALKFSSTNKITLLMATIPHTDGNKFNFAFNINQNNNKTYNSLLFLSDRSKNKWTFIMSHKWNATLSKT